MKVDKHGYKMTGLRRASGRTKKEDPFSNWHYQINYNMDTGEVWTDVVYGDSWTTYRLTSIKPVIGTSEHMTMQSIADAVAQYIECEIEYREYL